MSGHMAGSIERSPITEPTPEHTVSVLYLSFNWIYRIQPERLIDAGGRVTRPVVTMKAEVLEMSGTPPKSSAPIQR